MNVEAAVNYSPIATESRETFVEPDVSSVQEEIFSTERFTRAQGIADLLTFVGEGVHNYAQPGMPPIKKEVLPGVHIYYIHFNEEDGSVTLRVLQHHFGYDNRFGVRNGTGWRGEETKAVLEAKLLKDQYAENGWSINHKFLRNENLQSELQRYERLRYSQEREEARIRHQDRYDQLLYEVSLLDRESPSLAAD